MDLSNPRANPQDEGKKHFDTMVGYQILHVKTMKTFAIEGIRDLDTFQVGGNGPTLRTMLLRLANPNCKGSPLFKAIDTMVTRPAETVFSFHRNDEIVAKNIIRALPEVFRSAGATAVASWFTDRFITQAAQEYQWDEAGCLRSATSRLLEKAAQGFQPPTRSSDIEELERIMSERRAAEPCVRRSGGCILSNLCFLSADLRGEDPTFMQVQLRSKNSVHTASTVQSDQSSSTHAGQGTVYKAASLGSLDTVVPGPSLVAEAVTDDLEPSEDHEMADTTKEQWERDQRDVLQEDDIDPLLGPNRMWPGYPWSQRLLQQKGVLEDWLP